MDQSIKSNENYAKVSEHSNGERTLLDEYKLIKSNQSELPRELRSFVIGVIEEEK